MRAKTIVLVMAAAIFMLASNATAADNLVETVAKGCEKELTCMPIRTSFRASVNMHFTMRRSSLNGLLPLFLI